jgi:Na+/melibiose symporter-like transporter
LLAPAAFALLGIAIFAFYPLTDDRFREIVKELRTRRTGTALASATG